MEHDRAGSGIPTALRRRREQVLTRIALGSTLVVGFEAALYLAAVTLFTHPDTPSCAGSDTFCSPGGRAGWTGGAVVVLVGDAVGAVAVAVLLVRLVRHQNYQFSTQAAENTDLFRADSTLVIRTALSPAPTR